MPKLSRALAVLCLAVLTALLVVPLPAHAAGDTVKRLSVRYDVQADGSIDMRYELDWDFGEKGRRGVLFEIVTRESWEEDREQDVVYDVTDLRVSSPTGAPATFSTRDVGDGSESHLEVRIGDADQPLDESRHTYVVEYTMRGGMRTFDGVPELHLDVTGNHYPRIEEFDVTVTGPQPVDRARCLVGPDECEATVDGDGARLSGRDADSGEIITAVASFPAGSVSGAEPILEEKRLAFPELERQGADVQVRPDGTALVTMELEYRLPKHRDDHRFSTYVPFRRALTRTDDVLYRISDVNAVDLRGGTITTELREPSRSSTRFSKQDGYLVLELQSTQDRAHVELSYVVDGAVLVDGDTATFRWPIAHLHSYGLEGQTYTWTLPGAAASAEVVFPEQDDDVPSSEGVEADGGTVTFSPPKRSTSPNHWISIEFPADAVPGASTTIEPSLDYALWQVAMATGFGGGGGLVGLGAVGFLLSRRPLVRDLRYLNAAPGVRGRPGQVTPSPRGVNIPVRFEEPDTNLAVAGLLHDRTYKSKHLAALLISMAAKGAITLGSKPVRAGQVDATRAGKGFERNLFSAVPPHDTQLSRGEVLALQNRVKSEQDHHKEELFRDHGEGQRVRHGLMALFGVVIPIAVWGFYYLSDPASAVIPAPHYLAHNFILSVLLTIGSLAAFYCVWALPKRALTAEGTRLLDQLRGLETYIRTAEQHQLRFEEGQDVFSRFLPWAVLLGLTERWTEACRVMAEEGRIAPFSDSFAGHLGVAGLASGLDSGIRSATTVSSGGSGGSSGFSSSGGGSGGGGTGASSW
jgi:uncharacterized membrane protein YgcG